MKRIYTLLSITLLFIGGSLDLLSQTLTTTEYKKACWMTTRMYGGATFR
ncbi:MAG TPA: hypothetical protein PK734_05125 [Bacteroidales bacterium]|nr:hypothetical protein [Bacteroidales bacterium]